MGFVRQSFDVIVDGIEKSIIQAHENLRPGSIFVNKGKEKNLDSLSLLSSFCTYEHGQIASSHTELFFFFPIN